MSRVRFAATMRSAICSRPQTKKSCSRHTDGTSWRSNPRASRRQGRVAGEKFSARIETSPQPGCASGQFCSAIEREVARRLLAGKISHAYNSRNRARTRNSLPRFLNVREVSSQNFLGDGSFKAEVRPSGRTLELARKRPSGPEVLMLNWVRDPCGFCKGGDLNARAAKNMEIENRKFPFLQKPQE